MDDLLEKELGCKGFGPAQALTLVIGGIACLTSSTLMFLMTFTYADPLAGSGPVTWHCTSPSDSACDSMLVQYLDSRGAKPPYSEQLVSAAAPANAGRDSAVAVDDNSPQKTEPRTFCELQPSQFVWNDPRLTLSSEYNLVCGQAWKVTFCAAPPPTASGRECDCKVSLHRICSIRTRRYCGSCRSY